MQRTYIYANRPGDSHLPEADLIRVDRAGYPVDLGRIAIDNVPPFTAAAERPQLRGLLRRAARDDVIVSMSLACLGCSTRDVLATIDRCRTAELRLFCLDIGRVNLASRSEPAVVRALRSLVQLDTEARQSLSKESISVARSLGRRPGRPPALSAEERKSVLALLHKGLPVAEIARRFNTSRQTVLRIRDGTPAARERRQAAA